MMDRRAEAGDFFDKKNETDPVVGLDKATNGLINVSDDVMSSVSRIIADHIEFTENDILLGYLNAYGSQQDLVVSPIKNVI